MKERYVSGGVSLLEKLPPQTEEGARYKNQASQQLLETTKTLHMATPAILQVLAPLENTAADKLSLDPVE